MVKFRAVSHRMIFWILGASASLFLLISWYEYTLAEHFLRQQIRSEANLIKQDMVSRVDDLIDKVSNNVETIALLLPVVESQPERLKELLEKLVGRQSDIYGMTIALNPDSSDINTHGFAPYYYRQDGRVIYADLSGEDYDYQSKPWYRQAVESGVPVWSEPYYDDGGGNIAMVTYSVPVYSDDNHQLIGVVTADLTLDHISELVLKSALGQSGFAYIFTRKGNIITHSRPELVMRNVDSVAITAGNQSEYVSVLDGMQKGNTDTLHLDCQASRNGECWLSYQPIAGTHWSIAIVIPMDSLASSLLEYSKKSLTITAVGLLLLSVVVIFIARRLTLPLLALAQSTRALGRGELDTPVDDFNLNDEVGTLARQFRSMQASLKNYIQQLNQQTAQRERLEGELGAAHEIQMQMLPDHGQSSVKQAHWHLSALLKPAKSVGGDFYHYQLLDQQRLFFALGDVSDKGVAAALFMAKTQTLLRQLCMDHLDPGQLLGLVNRQLCVDNNSCMFVTLLAGTLDIASGDLQMASAGHTPPILFQHECQSINMETGAALGFYEDSEYTTQSILLPINSFLILTTDGIEEASNPLQQHYGEDRLQRVINAAHHCDAEYLLGHIHQSVVDFRAGAEPSDDLSIMIIARQ